MLTSNTEREIRAFIVDNFLFGQAEELHSDESLLDRGIINSTGVLELVAFIEEHFGIKVGDEDVVPDNFDSIRNLIAYVGKKSNGGVRSELDASRTVS